VSKRGFPVFGGIENTGDFSVAWEKRPPLVRRQLEKKLRARHDTVVKNAVMGIRERDGKVVTNVVDTTDRQNALTRGWWSGG